PESEVSARAPRSTPPDTSVTGARSVTSPPPPPVSREPAASSLALSQQSQPVSTPAVQPTSASGSLPSAPARTLASEGGSSFLPWLVAAFALALGLFFFLWRRHAKEAFAGGAEAQSFVAPEPSPQPPERTPASRPPVIPSRKPAAAKGIVSSRLRPAIEIGMQPLRCLVDDERVTIEFELELFNAGAAPARAVLPEARLLNAGAGQDQELMSFFTNPVGAGERLEAIAPMKRMSFTSQVTAPRAAIQEYELAGRKSFVPLIAFNALYSWSGGPAQTSAAYLVGRATKGNKLGPLRLDLGAHEFRELDARTLPAELRT
ncbi:MAG TPA: hypothetical protein VM711_00820, partial [Sphingomicrobium sp.]|nr:hypothetical protein [Sphingomicrobium sp.]